MANSTFWRTMALLAVCGLFYVGYGLTSGDDVPLAPSLTSPVYADGVAAVQPSDDLNHPYSYIATAVDEGRAISIWRLEHSSQNVRHIGYFPMDSQRPRQD